MPIHGLFAAPVLTPGSAYDFPSWAVKGISSQSELKAFRIARAASRFMYKFLREAGADSNAGALLYAKVQEDMAKGSVTNPSDELAGEAIGAWILYRLHKNSNLAAGYIASVESVEDFENAVIAQYYKFTSTFFWDGSNSAELAVKAADRVMKDSFSYGARETSKISGDLDLSLGGALAAALGYQNVLNRNLPNTGPIIDFMRTAVYYEGPFFNTMPAANINTGFFPVPPEYYDRVIFGALGLLVVVGGVAAYRQYKKDKADEAEYTKRVVEQAALDLPFRYPNEFKK